MKISIDDFIELCHSMGASPGAVILEIQKRMEAEDREIRCNDTGTGGTCHGDCRH